MKKKVSVICGLIFLGRKGFPLGLAVIGQSVKLRCLNDNILSNAIIKSILIGL